LTTFRPALRLPRAGRTPTKSNQERNVAKSKVAIQAESKKTPAPQADKSTRYTVRLPPAWKPYLEAWQDKESRPEGKAHLHRLIQLVLIAHMKANGLKCPATPLELSDC
jgi:hypothetical protein